MFKLFGDKPDHPMFDLAEARRLLGELPHDDVAKALEEITFWLDSINTAAGFTPELRNATIMLLDEAGQPRHAELLQSYLSAPHLRDFQGLRQWQNMHAFTLALSEAYSASIAEYRGSDKKNRELRERMPLVCIRQLRAVAEHMKLELMRYIRVEPRVWKQLGDGYSFAESEQCTGSMALPYPGHVIHTSPQRELLRALVLHISSPGTLAADQIEVSHRIAGRLTSFFEIKMAADPDCAYVFDLTAGVAPHAAGIDLEATPGMRFFSAVRAMPALKNICDQNENDPVWQERRSGSEFTPAGKLTVLKHLMKYWESKPPHRQVVRRDIHATLTVSHGFRVVSHLVTHIDIGQLPDENANSPDKRSRLDLAALDDIDYTTEIWDISDMSTDGFGALLAGTLGAWIKIGDLCALKPPNGELWWAGMIRRLHTDADNKVHVGIELLSKKPASVWLRILGKGAERVSHWETSSGSFAYDYLPVILLPDAQSSYLKASTMLMESGSFVADAIYQVMMGELSRDIKLTKLLAEGEDYEQVAFVWLT